VIGAYAAESDAVVRALEGSTALAAAEEDEVEAGSTAVSPVISSFPAPPMRKWTVALGST
jgi:hypothetical protein